MEAWHEIRAARDLIRIDPRRRLARRPAGRRLAGAVGRFPDHALASTMRIWCRSPRAAEPEDRSSYQARERQRSSNNHQQRR